MTGSPRDVVTDLTDRPQDVEAVLDSLRRAPDFEPFADELIGFCADFARRLGRAARGVPELTALAFWMRRTELVRLREAFRALATDDTVLVPRGTVLHIPPANVDTIFIYSWLLSMLVGNKNAVRLSSRRTFAVDLIMDVMAETLDLEAHAALRAHTAFVRYGHDHAVTARISQDCDVRVIWGGNQTVRTIRSNPLPPHAVELTFPDRASMAAVRATAYLDLTPDERDALAESFFNDAYWFDQMGCSSPRVVHWVGSADDARASASDFYPRLMTVVKQRGYAVDTAIAIRKMTLGFEAVLDHPVHRMHTLGNELRVLELTEFDPLEGEFAGAGTFFDVRHDELTDLVGLVERRDQTMTHFGFSRTELTALAAALNGRGIDRMVPFGQALNFNRYWDGQDLLQSFTRRVFIQAESEAPLE